jgi:hypothetical protein
MGGKASKNMYNQRVVPHYHFLARLTVGVTIFIRESSVKENVFVCQTVEGNYGNHTPGITAI